MDKKLCTGLELFMNLNAEPIVYLNLLLFAYQQLAILYLQVYDMKNWNLRNSFADVSEYDNTLTSDVRGSQKNEDEAIYWSAPASYLGNKVSFLIKSCSQHGVPWLFLMICPYHPSLLIGYQCSHGANVFKSLLVHQHWHIPYEFVHVARVPVLSCLRGWVIVLWEMLMEQKAIFVPVL